jgi:hypothetical protein
MPTKNQDIIESVPLSSNGHNKRPLKPFHLRSEAAQEIISRQPGFV